MSGPQSEALAGCQHEPGEQGQLRVKYAVLQADDAHAPEEVCLTLLQQVQSNPAWHAAGNGRGP